MTTVMLADGVQIPSKRTELLAVQGTLIGFAFVIVSLRLITRFCIVKSPGKDDYAIIFATVKPAYWLVYALCLLTTIQIMAIAETGLTLSYARHGGGLHHQGPEDVLYTLKVEGPQPAPSSG